ncbi:MAG: RNA 2',3'-cyclic phosphodiesterase [Lentisphaerae bacterium]|jgi:2'-5' RNA ligase|nr:RNA 2',3'-cyclic phosphodiesterase [Lentisphaerota bacterium]
MRLFVALKLPEELKKQLGRLCKPFAEVARDTKWSRPDQLHITLAFIGDVAPAFVPHLCKGLDSVCAAMLPLECEATGFGFFGSLRNPTILWAGVEPVYELEELHEALWRELRRLGYERLKYKFQPHISLARCKAKTRNPEVLEAMDSCPVHHFGSWVAEGVTLYESIATAQGARYRAVHTALFATE